MVIILSELLKVSNLSISFSRYIQGLRKSTIKTINDLSLSVNSGEIVAILGSSGSGKSLLAHAILGILPENAICEGVIKYKGNIIEQKDKEKLRGDEICFIPQSVNFLDPLMKISNQVIGEVKDKDDEKRKRINQRKIFEKYGLDKSVDSMYPFQLSGGMVRKVLLSTALLSNPDLIVADEPTPGLDTKDVEETIENIRKMKEDNKGVLLITHEIDVALKTADRIAIFYSGYVIEINDTKNFLSPSTLLHPYTKSLIKALPRNGFILTKGIQPLEDVKGCVYYENCPCKMNICKNIKPILIKYNNAKIRCHLYNREV